MIAAIGAALDICVLVRISRPSAEAALNTDFADVGTAAVDFLTLACATRSSTATVSPP